MTPRQKLVASLEDNRRRLQEWPSWMRQAINTYLIFPFPSSGTGEYMEGFEESTGTAGSVYRGIDRGVTPPEYTGTGEKTDSGAILVGYHRWQTTPISDDDTP